MKVGFVVRFIRRQVKEIKLGGTNVLVSKFIIFAQLCLRFLLGGITVLFCYAIKPLLTVRFGRIYTSRIGHLCYNMDNYLADRLSRESKEFAVFKADKHISNQTIYLLWGNNKNILFTNFADFPLWFLETILSSSALLISWQNELHPKFPLASLMPSNINIDDLDEQEYRKILEVNKIAYPFICLHNRDSAYINYYGSDGNAHDFRDFDFHDFQIGINRITEFGVTVVRIGEIIKTPYVTNNRSFVSITGTKRSDFSDIVLVSKCLFFVGCNSGFSTVSRIFRKPTLLINYIPFQINELSAWAKNSIILPKKLYKNSECRYLRFSEMAELPYDIHYKGDFFSDMGLQVENNAPEEIADALMEMWMRTTGAWSDSEMQHQLQDKFWASIDHIMYSSDLRGKFGIRISSTFLEKNHFLL